MGSTSDPNPDSIHLVLHGDYFLSDLTKVSLLEVQKSSKQSRSLKIKLAEAVSFFIAFGLLLDESI